MLAYFQRRDIYVQDLIAGSDPAYQLKVRVISESPWHSLFARNMFRQPKLEEMADFTPEITIMNAPYFQTLRNGMALIPTVRSCLISRIVWC